LFSLLGAGALAAAAWWTPLLVPVLWGRAGAPRIVTSLPLEHAAFCGPLGLLLLSVVHAARTADPAAELRLRTPRPSMLLAGAWVGLFLGFLFPGAQLGAHAPLLASERLAAALTPAWTSAGTLLLLVLADELLFRGWLPRIAGPAAALL